MGATFSFLHNFWRLFGPSPDYGYIFEKYFLRQNNFTHPQRSCQRHTRLLFFMKQVFSLRCMRVIWFVRKCTYSLYHPIHRLRIYGYFLLEMHSDLWVLYLRPNGASLYEKGYPNSPKKCQRNGLWVFT